MEGNAILLRIDQRRTAAHSALEVLTAEIKRKMFPVSNEH